MATTSPLETPAISRIEEQTDLYRFFAYALASPTRERFATLRSAEFAATLRNLWPELGCPGAFPGTRKFKNYEAYESAYIALFDVGAPEPPVPLVESGHYKSIPAQQIALENISFYEVLGLNVDTGRAFPDHLIAQLEFAAAVRYTGEQTDVDENKLAMARLERDFLQRHLLNWLPLAEAKLAKLAVPLFPTLIPLLVRFLRWRQTLLAGFASAALGSTGKGIEL